MKTDLQKVLAISGYSGLYMYVAQSANGIIVESMADKKRSSMPANARMTSLADIAVFTATDELRLKVVLERMRDKQDEIAVPAHKSDDKLLKKYFGELISDYDKDRFYVSHMKKVLEWFLLLKQNDALDFTEEEAPAEHTVPEEEK